MRLCRVLMLSLTLLASAFAADVTGKWKAEMPGRDGATREVMFNLKADGETLTGTMSGGMGGEAQITDGKVSGDDVSFSIVREFNGNRMVMKYSGKVEGNELKMKVTSDRMPEGRDIVAKRAVS